MSATTFVLFKRTSVGLAIGDLTWDYCKKVSDGSSVSVAGSSLIELAVGRYILINPNNINCFISFKEKYNIGVIGNIDAELKGRDLLLNISKLLPSDKYIIIIFGCHNERIPKNFFPENVKLYGRYENNNIFNILNEYNIDLYFFHISKLIK